MLKMYSPKKAQKIIRRSMGTIRSLSDQYELPCACLQAILYQEITQMDFGDFLADLAVRFYWARYRLRRRLRKKEAPRAGGVLHKKDSSTGYAQIFAYVGIRAVRFGLQKNLVTCEALGLPADHPLRPENPDDLCLIWHRLHRDPDFNLHLAALNLLSAAEEMTGRIDFPSYTPEELQLIFTRYNANARHITPYGETVYGHYLAYQAQRKDPPAEATEKSAS